MGRTILPGSPIGEVAGAGADEVVPEFVPEVEFDFEAEFELVLDFCAQGGRLGLLGLSCVKPMPFATKMTRTKRMAWLGRSDGVCIGN